MTIQAGTAEDVVAELEARHDPEQLATVRKRLAPDEPAIGLRMRDLFDVAKAHQHLPLDEVDRLLDHPAYESRMAAFCILDFTARRRIDDEQRRAMYELYLGRHERITTWDMVDRAAPRVVGGHLAGRSLDPLRTLAEAAAPLRRRTAITAPLYFVKGGSDDDLAGGFRIASMLASDPDPVVHNAVGIFVKHAGTRDEAAFVAFLDEHASSMARPAVRLATEHLGPDERARWRRD